MDSATASDGGAQNDNIPSRAEKNLAALAKFGGVEVDSKLIYSKLDENELSLMYEHRYASWDHPAKLREISELTQRVKTEKLAKQKADLTLAIAEAEQAGDEGRVEELMKELGKVLKNE